MTTNKGLVQSLPHAVGVEKGFFAKNGIDLSLVDMKSGPAAIQALLGGDADVMFNAPDFVILAGEQGKPVQIVAGNLISANTTLIARNGWPLPHAGSYPAAVADLKGAKIGVVARGSTVENQLRVMLQDAGLDADKDVTIIATGVLDTALPALKSGQVDAWVGFEPGTTIALEQMKLGVPVVDFRKQEGPEKVWDVNFNGYSFKKDYIDAHPDEVKRFVKAISETIAWMKDPANRAELETIAEKNVTVDPSVVPQLLDANLPTFGTEITEAKMQNSINMMLQFGLIKKAPAYEDIVATAYLPTS
jgi:NitT/TauT family transport system substrate-binding protein